MKKLKDEFPDTQNVPIDQKYVQLVGEERKVGQISNKQSNKPILVQERIVSSKKTDQLSN